MSMELSAKEYSTQPERFEAGLYPIAKTTGTAGADIPAHAPVALDEGGKLALLTGETTANVYGVTPDSIRNGEEGPVWLTGEFFADSLAVPEGVDAQTLTEALRKIGIFLK